MTLDKDKFNTSVANSFVYSEEFDQYLIQYVKFNTIDYFTALNLLSKVNDIKYETYNQGNGQTGYIASISQNNQEIKSTIFPDIKIDSSFWFGKELLYYFRDLHNTNKLNKNI